MAPNEGYSVGSLVGPYGGTDDVSVDRPCSERSRYLSNAEYSGGFASVVWPTVLRYLSNAEYSGDAAVAELCVRNIDISTVFG